MPNSPLVPSSSKEDFTPRSFIASSLDDLRRGLGDLVIDVAAPVLWGGGGSPTLRDDPAPPFIFPDIQTKAKARIGH